MNDDDLQEYIHTYKSDLLRDKDNEKNKAFERANNIDTHGATQLLLIGSALLTIIGGFVTSGDKITNDGIKVILTAAILFLLFSICAGLIDFYYTSDFFEKWGYHLHKQGRLIVDDESKTYDQLVALRNLLQQESDNMATRSPLLPRILQVVGFLLGIVFLLILVFLRIYAR